MLFEIEPSKLYGVDAKEIKKNNTKKPNLLFTLPSYDYNGAMSVPLKGRFLDDLRKKYDVYFMITKTEDQMIKYGKSVAKHAGGIDLYVLCAHGCPLGLELDKGNLEKALKDSFAGIKSADEQKYIDIGDYIKEVMNKNGILFLESCSTAGKIEKEEIEKYKLGNKEIGKKNLAELLSIPGITTYACKVPFSNKEMNYKVYPFKIKIVSKGKDNTYIYKGK